jgi:hypothetical protein
MPGRQGFHQHFRDVVEFTRQGGTPAEVRARIDLLDLFSDEKRVLNAMVAVAVGDRAEVHGGFQAGKS